MILTAHVVYTGLPIEYRAKVLLDTWWQVKCWLVWRKRKVQHPLWSPDWARGSSPPPDRLLHCTWRSTQPPASTERQKTHYRNRSQKHRPLRMIKYDHMTSNRNNSKGSIHSKMKIHCLLESHVIPESSRTTWKHHKSTV